MVELYFRLALDFSSFFKMLGFRSPIVLGLLLVFGAHLLVLSCTGCRPLRFVLRLVLDLASKIWLFG